MAPFSHPEEMQRVQPGNGWTSSDSLIREVPRWKMITYISRNQLGTESIQLLNKHLISVLFMGIMLALGAYVVARETIRRRNAQHAYRVKLESQVGVRTKELTRTIQRLHQEVVERTRAQMRLVEIEERLRKIMESAQDTIVMIDAEGRVVYWSAAGERMFGFTEAQMLGRDLNDWIVPKRLRSKVPNLFTHFINLNPPKEGRRTLESTAVNAAGREFPVELTISVVVLDGQPHAVGIVRDTSERYAAQQQIKLLSRAVEQSPVSVVITDPEGIIQFVNAAVVRVSGYSAQEMLGKPSSIFKSGETPPETYIDLWQTLSRGEPWSGELLNRKNRLCDGVFDTRGCRVNRTTAVQSRGCY
jgi:PAS domain S-box-containing protein